MRELKRHFKVAYKCPFICSEGLVIAEFNMKKDAELFILAKCATQNFELKFFEILDQAGNKFSNEKWESIKCHD